MFSNGIDIIEINRIKNILSNKILLNKIFTSNELLYIKTRNNNLETIAGLIAAKEATLKCLHNGLEGFPLTEIEITHENYAPYLKFYGSIKKEIEAKKLSFSVSISHDGAYAIASVIAFPLQS